MLSSGELTCKSQYAMSSNVHHCSECMLVPADPCMKKKRQTCGSVHALCEYTVCAVKRVVSTATQLCMLSPLSVSVLIQLSERMYGMVRYLLIYLTFSWHRNREYSQNILFPLILELYFTMFVVPCNHCRICGWYMLQQMQHIGLLSV